MEKALRLQEQLSLEKFEKMNALEKHRVMYRLNESVRAKGYSNEQELKREKPYIWNQMLAQVVRDFK
jgi:hypothetical protein